MKYHNHQNMGILVLFFLVVGLSLFVNFGAVAEDSNGCEVDFELRDIIEENNMMKYEYEANSPVEQDFILAATISGANQSYILRKRDKVDSSSSGSVSLDIDNLMDDGRLKEDLNFATASFAFDECGKEVWVPKDEVDKEVNEVSSFETKRRDRIIRRE